MEKAVYYNILYDYYGLLFTEIQKSYYEAYYFNNLTLTEIADNYGVSKNAISKTLKEVASKLLFYEDKLQLNANKEQMKMLLTQEEIKKIQDYI